MYGGAIVDLDGTVYRGDSLLPGAREGIETLRAAGIDVLFLSNKAIYRTDHYVSLLSKLGVAVEPTGVINSGAIAASYLAREHLDRTWYVVGESPLVAELEDAEVGVGDAESADALLVSMDRTFDYETLNDALGVLEGGDDSDEDAGVPFLATNADRTCPVEGGEIPDAGGMIGAIEGTTGRKLDLVLGKPSPIAVGVASERLGVAPAECLVIGDRLETDILMGQQAGMTTALVLTGVTDEDEIANGPTRPDFVLDSLADVWQVIGG